MEVPAEGDEVIGSPGAGVRGGCEPLDMGAVNPT